MAELVTIASHPKVGVKVYCKGDTLYGARLGFVNLDSARQSKIEASATERERPFPVGKADEEGRFCKVAASPSSQNLSGCRIERITLFLAPKFTLDCPSKMIQALMIPWLKNYANHQWSPFTLPPYKTLFAQKAAGFLQTVPPGSLISYKELAEAIGHPLAARAIGNFCRGNLFPLITPCHRVIPSTGALGCFTPDPRIKKQLLHFEGINSF